MGIARIVVIDPVRHHATRQNLAFDEVAHERDVLLRRQLQRQGDSEIFGKLGIRPFLKGFYFVPEHFGRPCDRPVRNHGSQPVGCVGRGHELLVQQSGLARIVDRSGLALEIHPRTMAIGRRQHRATAIPAADDAG